MLEFLKKLVQSFPPPARPLDEDHEDDSPGDKDRGADQGVHDAGLNVYQVAGTILKCIERLEHAPRDRGRANLEAEFAKVRERHQLSQDLLRHKNFLETVEPNSIRGALIETMCRQTILPAVEALEKGYSPCSVQEFVSKLIAHRSDPNARNNTGSAYHIQSARLCALIDALWERAHNLEIGNAA